MPTFQKIIYSVKCVQILKLHKNSFLFELIEEQNIKDKYSAAFLYGTWKIYIFVS